VENFAFGGTKTYLEHFGAHAFIADHMRWPDARVLRALSVCGVSARFVFVVRKKKGPIWP
jgi:hypothetical protein